MSSGDEVRFTDILTTASAVADYLNAPRVEPQHVVDAVALLREEKTLDDLGRPLSPLVRRDPTRGVHPGVQALVQRWFADLGSDVTATVDAAAIDRFLAEVQALPPDPPGG